MAVGEQRVFPHNPFGLPVPTPNQLRILGKGLTQNPDTFSMRLWKDIRELLPGAVSSRREKLLPGKSSLRFSVPPTARPQPLRPLRKLVLVVENVDKVGRRDSAIGRTHNGGYQSNADSMSRISAGKPVCAK